MPVNLVNPLEFYPINNNFPVPHAVRIVLGAELATLEQMLPIAFDGNDIEGVHKVRVTLRRLRTILKFGKPYFDKQNISIILAKLKHLGKIFGNVRDLDVFRVNFQLFFNTLIYSQQSFHTQIWVPGFQHEYVLLHKKIQEQILGHQFNNLQDQIRNLPQAQPISKLASPLKSLRPYLKEVLERQLNQLLTYPAIIPPETPYSNYHKLRLLAKTHRYTMEFFIGAINPVKTPKLIERMISFQDHLGALNDSVIAIHILDKAIRYEIPGELQKILSDYSTHQIEKRNSLKITFNQIWSDYKATKPLQSLQKVFSGHKEV